MTQNIENIVEKFNTAIENAKRDNVMLHIATAPGNGTDTALSMLQKNVAKLHASNDDALLTPMGNVEGIMAPDDFSEQLEQADVLVLVADGARQQNNALVRAMVQQQVPTIVQDDGHVLQHPIDIPDQVVTIIVTYTEHLAEQFAMVSDVVTIKN